MSSREKGLYSLLKQAPIYECTQRLLRPRDSRRRFVETFVRPNPGDRILDVGCGTGSVLACLPEVGYVGVDYNPSYIRFAQSRSAHRGEFRVGDITQMEELRSDEFDLAIALGVMHHLDDDAVVRLLTQVNRMLRPGGRFISHDPVWCDGQSYWARWWIGMDRGRYVRSQVELLQLIQPYFQNVTHVVVHDSLRVPFSEIILECATGGENGNC